MTPKFLYNFYKICKIFCSGIFFFIMSLSEKIDFFRCTLWTSSLEAIHKRSNLQSIYIYFFIYITSPSHCFKNWHGWGWFVLLTMRKKTIQTFQQQTQYVPVYWPWNGKDAFIINKKGTWALTFLVILLYSSLASLALIFSRRATSSGFWSERKKSQFSFSHYTGWASCENSLITRGQVAEITTC